MPTSVLKKPAIHRFDSALKHLQVDTVTLYAGLSIDPLKMRQTDASLSMDKYFALLDAASRQSKRRFLAVELAYQHDQSAMGVLVYLIRNAGNMQQALKILQRYISLVSPGASVSIDDSGDALTLSYDFPATDPAVCYQDVEGTVVQLIMMVREILEDNNWLPATIYLRHKALHASDTVDFPLDTTVVFDHPCSGIVIPKQVIDHPVPGADPTLLTILEAHVVQSTPELLTPDTTIEKIRLLISSGLGNTEQTSDDIAKALGMSRRTLHRRLQEQGLSFNKVREDIIVELAKTSLIDTSASVAEIAQQLGYADSSAFNKLFKRRTGNTPLQYRKSSRAG
jgi:AraC-like DNA-binding protein